jgi:hypothetical protein
MLDDVSVCIVTVIHNKVPIFLIGVDVVKCKEGVNGVRLGHYLAGGFLHKMDVHLKG